MIEEFFMNKHAKKLVELDVKLLDTQQTIAHLLLQYAPYVHPKFILKRKGKTTNIYVSSSRNINICVFVNN